MLLYWCTSTIRTGIQIVWVRRIQEIGEAAFGQGWQNYDRHTGDTKDNSRVGVNNFVQNAFDAMRLMVLGMGLFVLGGFRLGPGSDVSRTSPSRGVNLCLGVGASEVGFRLIPHFALGPIADVSSSASAGRDSLMLRVDNVDGWFNVRGPGLGDVGITSPPSRVMGVIRMGIFKDGFDAVRGLDPVSTPSSFLAQLPVFRVTRGG